MALDFSKREYPVPPPSQMDVGSPKTKESALSMLLEKSKNTSTIDESPSPTSITTPPLEVTDSPEQPSVNKSGFPNLNTTTNTHQRVASSSFRKTAPIQSSVQSSLQQQRDRARTGDSSIQGTPTGSFTNGYGNGHLFGAGEIGNVSSPRHYALSVSREKFDPSSVDERFVVNIPKTPTNVPGSSFRERRTSSVSLSRSMSKVSLSRSGSRSSVAGSFTSLRRFVEKPWKNSSSEEVIDSPISGSFKDGSPSSSVFSFSRKGSVASIDNDQDSIHTSAGSTPSASPLLSTLDRAYAANLGGTNHALREKHRQSLSKAYGKQGKTLGEGAGGHVKIVKSSVDNEVYAVKEFRARHSNETVRQYNKKVGAEYCLGLTLKHPNIVNTLDIIYEPTKVYQVMEYAAFDLFAIVMSGKMSREEVYCDFRQLMAGLKYLHSIGLAHRDIKLDNCVVTDKGIVKIIDFGSSVVFKYPESDKVYDCDGIVGSDPYLAPEAAGKDRYDPAPTDIWSCGIVFACMLMRKFPWRVPRLSDPAFNTFVKIDDDGKSRGMEKILATLPKETHELLTGMLDLNPKTRFTIEQCWNIEWLKCEPACTIDKENEVVNQPGHTHTAVSFEEAHIAMLEQKNRKAKKGQKMW